MSRDKNGLACITCGQGGIWQYQFSPKHTSAQHAAIVAGSHGDDFVVEGATSVYKIGIARCPFFALHHHKVTAAPAAQGSSGQVQLALKGKPKHTITRSVAVEITRVFVAGAAKCLEVLPFLGKNHPR